MKCIILAAGTSTRLRPVAGEIPKCLIQVGGKTILERIIENVLIAGAKEIGVVLGYKSAEVRGFLKQCFPSRAIRFMVNPRFESTNNAFSLLMARDFYKRELKSRLPLQTLLLLDSDIVFSQKLLPFLLNRATFDAVAVRVKGDHDDEEIRVTVDASKHILRIGKDIPLSEAYGESVGIELFTPATAEKLFDVLEKRVRHGAGRAEFYEASFQELVGIGLQLRAVDIGDFPAAEVDTPEDLKFVEDQIIPRIEAEVHSSLN